MTPRVVHAVDQFLARSETFVYTIVTGHQRYEASVLCHARANADEFPFPRVHVQPKPVSRRTPAWWMAALAERATGRSPWRRGVDAALARVDPVVVHAHFGPIGCEMIPVTRAAGLPLVTSLYGVDAAVLPYLPQWRARYARLFREGDLFLAEGPEMRKKVIAAGAPADRTCVHPIALNLTKYPRWSPDGSATVLFAGRFVEKKGLLDAIAAFGLARAQMPRARLTIVGGGGGEDDARARVSELGLADAVEFVGMQPHADVIRRLSAAAVFIHPSVTAGDGDSEGGAPTILLEAQAIGTPIVTTRHADIPHVVPEGPGVYLCAEHDVDALGRSLVAAMESGIPSSAAHVIAHHDAANVVPRLEDLYTRVVEGAAMAQGARR
ncbi:MAG TPA: glycosyltransferase [Vicinamibacterales bacterium]|nr:glycosyltransferase [Vicinamibacterales bacterium]